MSYVRPCARTLSPPGAAFAHCARRSPRLVRVEASGGCSRLIRFLDCRRPQHIHPTCLMPFLGGSQGLDRHQRQRQWRSALQAAGWTTMRNLRRSARHVTASRQALLPPLSFYLHPRPPSLCTRRLTSSSDIIFIHDRDHTQHTQGHKQPQINSRERTAAASRIGTSFSKTALRTQIPYR